MSTKMIGLVTFGVLIACGEKEDTAVVDTAADTQTEETGTEETGTEETGTDETDAPVDVDGDGHLEGDDCNDNDASIYPGAFDNPENDVDEDCNGTPAKIVDFVDGLINPSFEDTPVAWKNLGDTFAIQSDSENMFGDDGDFGVPFEAYNGNKFVKIWPDAGSNDFGDESPVYQEWFATENNISDKVFYISALGLVHESSLLKGLTEALVMVKCFDREWKSTGEGKSIALNSISRVNQWEHLYALGTCGPETAAVQAVLSLQTPDEDVDGDGNVSAGESQRTGNVYFDNVKFGVYSN